MKVALPYGRREVILDTGVAEVRVLEPNPLPSRPEEEVLHEALASPLGTPRLASILSPGESVVVVVSDVTRVAGTATFMPLLLRELEGCEVTVLFALGAHRKMTPDEQVRALGQEVFGRVRVVQHDAFDPAGLAYVGTTSRGTPVYVNRIALEADRLVLTGAAVYHDFAGFSGGRKSILPGIAGCETIQSNHRLLLTPEVGGGRLPTVASGTLEGNPVHEDMLEAALLVRPDFILNTVISPEERIVGACAGDLAEAHARACELAREVYGVPAGGRADVVVASCGGFPRDIDYYQATKAIDNASHAVRDGGAIVLVAECSEGVGPFSYKYWFDELATVADVDRALRENFEIMGYMALMVKELREKRGVDIIGVTELSAEDCAIVGMEKAPDADSALRMARERAGDEVIVIPAGSYVVPLCQ